MAVAQGYGKTVTSGSVFAYDVADTRNSYIGEPTVNIHANSENVSSWTGNLFGNWIDSGVSSNTVVAPNGTLTGDVIGDGFGRFNASSTATPGQTYTYSVYLKNVTLTSGFFIWYAFGLNGSLVSYGSPLFIPITSINNSEWTRFAVTVTAPGSGINQVQFGPCPFTGYNYGSTYSSPTYNASGAQLAVWGGQIEQKSHATPYVAGTRSATQGLLPLVGDSTLDLSNMSFNSNAQMVFDGTNDYISTTPFNPNFSVGITMECVAKWTSSPGGSWQRMFDFGNGASVDNLLFCRYSGTDQLWFGVYNGAGTEYALSNSGAILFGQYALYTATADGTNFKIYVNGQLIYSTANSTVPVTTPRANNYIGKSNWPDSYFNGDIPTAKIYNRGLSAGEVRQNYLHYKTRFNLS